MCQNNNHVTKEMMKKNLQRLSEDECLDIITRMTEKCIDKYLTDYRFEFKEKKLELKANVNAEFIPEPAFGFHLL